MQDSLPTLLSSPLLRLGLVLLGLLVFTHDLRRAYGGSHLAWQPVAPGTPTAAHPTPDPSAVHAQCLASQLELGRAGRLLEASLAPRSSHPRALAIAVPVYPPHFEYLLNFLAPLATAEGPSLGWDLYPVFSSEEDAAAFQAYLASKGQQEAYTPLYTPLILAWDPLVEPRLAATAQWGFRPPVVLYKNLHALALLHPCYTHLAVLDAEVVILRPERLVAAFAARAAGGLVLAGYVPRYRYFNLWSSCMFAPEDRAALAALTRDNCLYSWWSDVPVYIAGDVPAFLGYIGYPVHFANPQGNEFAHLSYELWKVMRGEWQAVDLSDAPVHYSTCGSLEMMGEGAVYRAVVEAFPPGPRWLSAAFCAKNPGLCEGNEDVVLLYHLNRGVELLELAARQTCEPQHFNLDPERNAAKVRQGCVWYNGSRSDVSPPIVTWD